MWQKNLVYQATVHQENSTKETYIGLASTDFKTRKYIHEHSFKNPEDNQTALSQHILELKRKKVNYTVSWKLIDNGKPFSPVSGVCSLCTKEKFHILFEPSWATLNFKSEIYANCMHKKTALLVKKCRKKKKQTRQPG